MKRPKIVKNRKGDKIPTYQGNKRKGRCNNCGWITVDGVYFCHACGEEK